MQPVHTEAQASEQMFSIVKKKYSTCKRGHTASTEEISSVPSLLRSIREQKKGPVNPNSNTSHKQTSTRHQIPDIIHHSNAHQRQSQTPNNPADIRTRKQNKENRITADYSERVLHAHSAHAQQSRHTSPKLLPQGIQPLQPLESLLRNGLEILDLFIH